MKAYRDIKGRVMAVFKSSKCEYGIYIKRKEKDPFILYEIKQSKCKTRQEAEAVLDAYVKRPGCADAGWKLINLGRE